MCGTLLSIRHISTSISTDSLLQHFWETEEVSSTTVDSPEEQTAITHFNNTHIFVPPGRYRVTLPRKPDAALLGESRQQAVKRFFSNERSLSTRGTWDKFQEVMKEYVDLVHAEPPPLPLLPPPLPLPLFLFFLLLFLSLLFILLFIFLLHLFLVFLLLHFLKNNNKQTKP